MKNIFLLMTGLVLCLIAGCSKFLEEDLRGKVIGDAALDHEAGLESALTGSYKGLAVTFGMGFIAGAAADAAMGADDITCPRTLQLQTEFETMNVSTNDVGTRPIYQGCYKAIQGANNVIANYERTKGDANKIKIIAGEAFFIRALSYYWLVRYYKNIPIITEPNFTMMLLSIKRSGPEEVYKLIEEDLAKAETLLGNTKRDYGRSNKGSAKALLADVYLTQAGWPIKDQSKYALAAAKAKEVIDNKALYGFDLVPSIAALFANDPDKPEHVEDVFAITTNKANGTTSNSLLGQYYLPNDIGGWNVAYSELYFFNNFPAGARKDATFAYTYKKSDGTILTWQQLSSQHPYFKKRFINANNPPVTWQSSLQISMMRYAHVLTIYAEAKARSGGPDQLAYDCINLIRTRAGLAPLSGLSANDFAKAVVQERAWEFAAENNRFFDLVRLEMLKAANSNRDPIETPLDPNTITESDYIFPFPSTEFLINPDL
ncbi:RagB/SusD family nutrient uptake outer membrane protein [Flavitalea antarctica]